MKDLQQLSKSELLNRTLALVAEERKITIELIKFLREVERRMLYSELGFSSLWEFCVKRLGLSEGSAQRRISAMRLVRDVPVAAESLASGKLSLTAASQLQSFFLAEKKHGKPHSTASKKEIVVSIEGLSKRACDQKLAEISPQSSPKAEKVTVLSPTLSELKIVLDSRLVEKLDQLKKLLSHRVPLASYAELIEHLVDRAILEVEKKRGTEPPRQPTNVVPSESSRNRASQKHRVTPPPAIVPSVLEGGSEIRASGESKVQPMTDELKSECVPSNHSDSTSVVLSHAVIQPRRSYISIAVRRKVWKRAQNQCEFVNPLGQRCAAQYALELDHVQPVSQGGTNDFSNLRILCKNHNCYQAKIILGAAAMQPYLPSLG